jgi:uncharacterized membrane protein required for colicin V production
VNIDNVPKWIAVVVACVTLNVLVDQAVPLIPNPDGKTAVAVVAVIAIALIVIVAVITEFWENEC